jgi:hypothetical protein
VIDEAEFACGGQREWVLPTSDVRRGSAPFRSCRSDRTTLSKGHELAWEIDGQQEDRRQDIF